MRWRASMKACSTDFRDFPGVRAATAFAPSRGRAIRQRFLTFPARAPRGPSRPVRRPWTPLFLATMQIPVLLGRGLQQRDLASPMVAVITQNFAKTFFGRESGRAASVRRDEQPVDRNRRCGQDGALQFSEGEDPVRGIRPIHAGFAGTRPTGLRTAHRRRSAGAAMASGASCTKPARVSRLPSTRRREHRANHLAAAHVCQIWASVAALALHRMRGTLRRHGVHGGAAHERDRHPHGAGRERRRIVWMVLREVFAAGGGGTAIGLARR